MSSSAARLILICGLPGSGKTTLARQLTKDIDAISLSGDEWMAELGIDLWDEEARSRIERLLWIVAQDFLRHGVSVILESGFWLRSDRDEKRLGAREQGSRVELRYLPTSKDELVRQLEVRNAQHMPATAQISAADIESWLPLFQPPTDEELALFDPPTDAE